MRSARTVAMALVPVLATAVVAALWLTAPRMSAAPSGSSMPTLPAPGLGYAAGGPLPAYDYSVAPGVLESVRMYIPDEIMVYRMIHKPPTKADVRKIAACVGIVIPDEQYAQISETQDGHRYRVSLNDVDVEVEDDGSFHIAYRNEQPRGTESPEAPPDDVVKRVADKYLTRTGLLPEGCRFKSVSTREAVTFTPKGSKDNVTRVISKTAIYAHYRGGFEDGSVVLDVNGGRRVCAVWSSIRNVEPLANYLILSPEEAIERLGVDTPVVGPGGTIRRDRRIHKAVIDRIELVYFAGWNEPTMQPIYQISGAAPGFADRFAGRVLAVRPGYLAPPGLGHPGGG